MLYFFLYLYLYGLWPEIKSYYYYYYYYNALISLVRRSTVSNRTNKYQASNALISQEEVQSVIELTHVRLAMH